MQQSGKQLLVDVLLDTLSRSGTKETTLDYEKDFAERRGIAGQLRLHREIDVVEANVVGQRATSHRAAWEAQGRPVIDADRVDQPAGPERNVAGTVDRQPSQRRSAFAGLKLGPAVEAPKLQTPPKSNEERQVQADVVRRGMFAGLKLNVAQERSQGEDSRDARPASCH